MRTFLLLASILATALTSFTSASAAPDILRTTGPVEAALEPEAQGAGSARAGVKAPLRVHIRSGPKSHGPGAHDYPRFLKEWVPLLNERGAKATGSETFPTKAELDPSDKTPTYQLLIALRRAGRQEEVRKLVVRVRELLDEEKASEIARNRFRLVKAEPDAERKR